MESRPRSPDVPARRSAVVLALAVLAGCRPSGAPGAPFEPSAVGPDGPLSGPTALAATAGPYGPTDLVSFRLHNGSEGALEYGPCRGTLQRLGVAGWGPVEPVADLVCDDVLFGVAPGATGWLGLRSPDDYAVPLGAYRVRPGTHRLALPAAVVGGRPPLAAEGRRPVTVYSAPFEVGR